MSRRKKYFSPISLAGLADVLDAASRKVKIVYCNYKQPHQTVNPHVKIHIPLFYVSTEEALSTQPPDFHQFPCRVVSAEALNRLRQTVAWVWN